MGDCRLPAHSDALDLRYVVNSSERSGNVFDRIRKLGPLFFALVVIPVSAAVLYFLFFASDIYVSESSYVVRSPDSPKISGLGMILNTGLTSGNDESATAANAYMESRDALQFLNRGDFIKKAYSAPGISVFDRFNPLGLAATNEDLYAYLRKRVRIEHDRSTSITTVTVSAYNARDAQKINQMLVQQAEAVINTLNTRARTDLIGVAQREAQAAQDRLRKSSVALATFRNRERIIDPERQASASIQLMSKLQGDLVTAQAQYSELSSIAPRNPQLQEIRFRIEALKAALDDERSKLAGGGNSIASTGIEYQRLTLDNTLAEKELALALNNLQEARNSASKKQSYIEALAQPSLPDKPDGPKRIRGILATIIISMIVWGLAKVLVTGIREHQD